MYVYTVLPFRSFIGGLYNGILTIEVYEEEKFSLKFWRRYLVNYVVGHFHRNFISFIISSK